MTVSIVPKVIYDWWELIIAQASVTALEMVIFIEYLMLRVKIVLDSLAGVVTSIVFIINKVFGYGLVTIVGSRRDTVQPLPQVITAYNIKLTLFTLNAASLAGVNNMFLIVAVFNDLSTFFSIDLSCFTILCQN